jgi:hypothetical protein
MKRSFKTLSRWSIRVVAIVTVIAFPALAVFDRFSPWTPAVEAFSAYTGQTRVCIGVGTSSVSTPTARHATVWREFFLFPQVLTAPHIITVTLTDDAAVVVSEDRFAFLFTFAIFIVALIYCVRLVQVRASNRYAQSTGST